MYLLNPNVTSDLVYQKLNIAIFWFDELGTIKEYNQEARKLLGINEEELIGVTIYDICPDTSKHFWEAHFSDLKEKKVIELDSFVLNKGEGIIPVKVKAVHHTIDGKSYNCALVSSQIESKLLESKLDNVSSELDALLYGISHNLSGPVKTLKGLLSLTSTHFKDNKEELLEIIKNTTEKLNGTIEGLEKMMNFRKKDLQIEEVNISELILFALQTKREKYCNIDFKINTDDLKTSIVDTDASIVRTVIEEVIENAFRFSQLDAQPSIIIRTELNDNNALLTISNNGMTLSAKELKRAFGMFVKCNVRVEGKGIGLYMVKNALTLINGSITLTNVKDEFTQCSILIPKSLS